MAGSLFTQLMNDIKGDGLNNVASALGENPSRTESALGFALPALLVGLARHASSTGQAASLLDVIKHNNLDTGTYADAFSALGSPGGTSGLMSIGRPLMESIFGVRAGSMADWVTSRSGINRSSSSSLLSLALPIVLGMIAKRVRASGWGASSLISLLEEQRAGLPDTPGLATALDTGTTRIDIERERGPYVETYRRERVQDTPVVHARSHESTGGRSSWMWALPLLFLIPLLGYFMSRGSEPRRVAENKPAAAPIIVVPRARVPEPAAPVGTSGVSPAAPREFGPYRIEFQTGSNRLTAESVKALREAADVLKANQGVRAVVNGYTDNAGNPGSNMKLSEARAMSTMNQLTNLGVARSRVTAKGYGEDNPVADNGTAEGRQRNRRVEISVTNP